MAVLVRCFVQNSDSVPRKTESLGVKDDLIIKCCHLISNSFHAFPLRSTAFQECLVGINPVVNLVDHVRCDSIDSSILRHPKDKTRKFKEALSTSSTRDDLEKLMLKSRTIKVFHPQGAVGYIAAEELNGKSSQFCAMQVCLYIWEVLSEGFAVPCCVHIGIQLDIYFTSDESNFKRALEVVFFLVQKTCVKQASSSFAGTSLLCSC